MSSIFPPTQVGNLVPYGVKLFLKSHSYNNATAVSRNMPSLNFYHSTNIFMTYFIKLSICKKIRIRIQKNILPHCVILVSTLMERFIRRKYLSFCGSKDRRGKAKTRQQAPSLLLIGKEKKPCLEKKGKQKFTVATAQIPIMNRVSRQFIQ